MSVNLYEHAYSDFDGAAESAVRRETCGERVQSTATIARRRVSFPSPSRIWWAERMARYDRPSSLPGGAVSDPQLAVFETAIANRG